MSKILNKSGKQKRFALSQPKGFTLIELLIVVAIIGLLSAVAIPTYLGMQDRSRKGAVIRTTAAGESEIQAWLNSAVKGIIGGTGYKGQQIELDTNGNGIINAADVNNYTLGQDLGTANQLCSRYVLAKWNLEGELSPWPFISGALWVSGAAQAGKIACSHGAGGTTITMEAQESKGMTLYLKKIYSD